LGSGGTPRLKLFNALPILELQEEFKARKQR